MSDNGENFLLELKISKVPLDKGDVFIDQLIGEGFLNDKKGGKTWGPEISTQTMWNLTKKN